MSEQEPAIDLREAARRLGLSYQTLYARRHEIAFRLPGCRSWRVWPSALAELQSKRYNVIRLALRSDDKQEEVCQSRSVVKHGGSISARQVASELDDLLKQATARPRRSTTTS